MNVMHSAGLLRRIPSVTCNLVQVHVQAGSFKKEFYEHFGLLVIISLWLRQFWEYKAPCKEPLTSDVKVEMLRESLVEMTLGGGIPHFSQ